MCWDMSGRHSRVVASRGPEGPRSNQLTYGLLSPLQSWRRNQCWTSYLQRSCQTSSFYVLKTYFGFSFQKVSPITNTNRTRKSTTYLMSVPLHGIGCFKTSDGSYLHNDIIVAMSDVLKWMISLVTFYVMIYSLKCFQTGQDIRQCTKIFCRP